MKAASLTPPAKLLLWAIYNRAGNGKGECTASAATLAADQGLTGPNADRRVRTWLKKLKADGWIMAVGKAHSPRSRIVVGPTFHAAAQAEFWARTSPSPPRQKRLGVSSDDALELGINHPSSTIANPDDFSGELGRKAPPTRKIFVVNSDEIVLQTSPEHASRTTPETPPGGNPLWGSRSQGEEEAKAARERFVAFWLGRIPEADAKAVRSLAERNHPEDLAAAIEEVERGSIKTEGAMEIHLNKAAWKRHREATPQAARLMVSDDSDIPW